MLHSYASFIFRTKTPKFAPIPITNDFVPQILIAGDTDTASSVTLNMGNLTFTEQPTCNINKSSIRIGHSCW